MKAYQDVLPTKQLLSLQRLIYLADTDLPRSTLTPCNLGIQGPPNDLMTVAYAYDLDAPLR